MARGWTAAGATSTLFNSGIAGIDEADALLIMGSNPRREAPVLNARIRKRQLAGHFPIGVIGPHADLTYHAEWLGDGPAAIAAMPEAFAKLLGDAKRPMVIIGQAALARPDGSAMLAAAWKLASQHRRVDRGVARLQRAAHGAARVGALDLGFLPAPAPRRWTR